MDYEDIKKVERQHDRIQYAMILMLTEWRDSMIKVRDGRFEEYKQQAVKGVPYKDRIKLISDEKILMMNNKIKEVTDMLKLKLLPAHYWIEDGDIEKLKKWGLKKFCWMYFETMLQKPNEKNIRECKSGSEKTERNMCSPRSVT